MLGKLRQDYTPLPARTAQPRGRLTTDLSGAMAAPSPARALQEELEMRAAGALDDKWSARRRLAFIVASASTLWLAVIAAGGGLLHAIV